MENKSIKNITFVISGLTKGGSERVISVLSNEFSNQNIAVNVVVMRSTICAYEFNKNVNIEFIAKHKSFSESFYIWKSINPIELVKRLFQLIKTIRRYNTDVVVAFGESSSLYVIFTKLFVGKPVIVCMRQDPKMLSSFIRFLMKLFYRFADLLIVQTLYQKDWCNKYLKNLRTVLVPNPLSISYNINPYATDTKSIDFLSVGTIKKEKNYKDSILAFNAIKSKISKNAKYYIAGRFMTENHRLEITELIKKNRLNKRVILLGSVDNVDSLYRKAKIFILSSSNEGLPNALLEAMSHGIPCISSEWSGAHDILTKDSDSIVVPIGDTKELSKAMLKLYNDKNLRNKIGEKGYLNIRDNYEIKKVSKKWFETLNQISH